MRIQPVFNGLPKKVYSRPSIAFKPAVFDSARDVVIYKEKTNPRENLNIMINLKDEKQVGRMMLDIRKGLVYICELFIYPGSRGKGYGTMFLDYAKKISEESGNKGRMKLFAALISSETRPPHAFYRKYGFYSRDTEVLEQVDKCIAENKELPTLIDPIVMRYGPELDC